jgi:hypothetical protein
MSEIGALAQALQTYGGWGVAACELLAIAWLAKQVLAAHAREVAMVERVLPLADRLTRLVEDLLRTTGGRVVP